MLFARGKKTTTLEANDLPQGLIGGAPLEPDPDDDAGPAYPTVLQQVRNNMRKFDHCVLLTRVGNFYELYFEHAEEYGPLLNLKVSLRRSRPGLGPIPMAGFPYFQLDRFLKMLVQDLNKYVAISEEFRNDASGKVKSGGLLFDRKVSRIITPGTLIDEKFIDPWESNYCLSVHIEEPEASGDEPPEAQNKPPHVGLAWLDLSSGEFFTQSTTMAELSSALALIGPREVVVDSALGDPGHTRLVDMLEEDRHVITFHGQELGSQVPDDYARLVTEAVPGCNLSAFPPLELGAAAFLLDYVHTQLQGSSVALQPPVRRDADEFMSIDKNTLRALELRTTLREGKLEGSLLHSVRKTVTKSGTRLLTQRLTSPSMSLDIINQRLDLVAALIEGPALRENLAALLRRSFDTWRLVQKFSIGRGDADDLLELSKTVQITKDVAQLLENETNGGESLDGLVDDAKLRIRSEEQRVFSLLRAEVVRNLVYLRRNAAVLDELDVACSFATLAEERGLVRPKLNHGTAHEIVGGRHPVVESGLMEQGRNFTSNSLYAEIGLVDKIFSRVGSADNLYQDQSTFMVEMLETAEILKQATPRSFVIMDEVGRGTTPEDGIAVGYACLHHLYHVNRCRTLFATHFHSLADMTAGFEKLGCYCTDVEEGADGTFAYVHRLRKGINRKSHALKVARVAGLPDEAIKEAERVLEELASRAGDRQLIGGRRWSIVGGVSIVTDGSITPPCEDELEDMAAGRRSNNPFSKGAPYVKPPVHIDYGTNLQIGASTFINRNFTVCDTPVLPVTIGERCLIGPNTSIYAVGHPLDYRERAGPLGAPSLASSVTIEDDCWIGGSVIIMPGVRIGRGCVIGAGSVVTKDVPPEHLAYGNPARVIRKVADAPAESELAPARQISSAHLPRDSDAAEAAKSDPTMPTSLTAPPRQVLLLFVVLFLLLRAHT
ncbi:putative dna mismatch repair protein muts [Diplodia seriata]|uniref:Putative dna mismatch repair protein muts n=1 Tax=Diplodia seriata TaxID=420778 RepID=A0A0G2HC90_9PEZI|nr:putative dna mismatch repair protein muts [Diplodia seriata]